MEIETIYLSEKKENINLTENMINLYEQCNGKKHSTEKIKFKRKSLEEKYKQVLTTTTQITDTIKKLTEEKKRLESENMKLKAECFGKLKFNKR